MQGHRKDDPTTTIVETRRKRALVRSTIIETAIMAGLDIEQSGTEVLYDSMVLQGSRAIHQLEWAHDRTHCPLCVYAQIEADIEGDGSTIITTPRVNA